MSYSTINLFDNEGSGIWIAEYGSEYGDNIVRNNNILNNGVDGISLLGSKADDIFNNNISQNSEHGVYIDSSTTNTEIYQNNFFKNGISQAKDDGYNNTWDNGYPSGGNYWSDYNGSDNFSGPNQDIPGSDGIGDTPYNIPGGAGAQDRYPFMNENGWLRSYTKTDVGVTTNITLANPSDLVPYLPPEYAGMDMSDAIVLNVSVTDNTPCLLYTSPSPRD